MALTFPSNPSVNDTYVYGDVTYTFDGTKWTATTISGDLTLTDITDVVLSSPTDNQVLSYDISSGKWINQTFDLSDKLSKSGDTMTGNLSLGDNVKLNFGASSDLQIYHDGTNSYIADVATGDLIIKGTNLSLQNTVGENYVTALSNGVVKLYYDNSERLSTTSTGLDIGRVTNLFWNNNNITDPLLANNRLRFTDTDTSSGSAQPNGTIEWYTNDTSGVGVNAYIAGISNGNGGGSIQFGTSTVGGSTSLTAVMEPTGLTITGDLTANKIRSTGDTIQVFSILGSSLSVGDAYKTVRAVNEEDGYNYSAQLFHRDDLKLKTTDSGVTVTGNITVSGTVDGYDVGDMGSKLAGIEAGATADQTAAEIMTAIKTVDGSGSGLDADLLDGQHGSYYYSPSNPPAASAPTSAQVGSATAGLSAGAVGTYAWLAYNYYAPSGGSPNIRNFGSTEAGSNLIASGAVSDQFNSGTLNAPSSISTSIQSGTWRAMGATLSYRNGADGHTLWLRIA